MLMKVLSLMIILILLAFPAAAWAGDPVTPGVPEMPSQPADSPSYQEHLLELVNQARWDNGQLPPLKGSSQLDSSATTHSSNMAVRNFFAHCDLDTKTNPGDRIAATGYHINSWGENIAAGYSTPEQVMAGWMSSSGHRSNILNTGFREIGIGYVYQSGDQPNVRKDDNRDCNSDGTYNYGFGAYWTQNFGRDNSVYPLVINREAFQTDSREVDLYVYAPAGTTEMRFRNEAGDWSAWQPYQPDAAWTLSPGTGQKAVTAETRTSPTGSTVSSSDSILSNDDAPVTPTAVLEVDHSQLGFGFTQQDPETRSSELVLSNSGTAALDWDLTVTPAAAWLAVSMHSGSLGPGESVTVSLTADRQGLAPGSYSTELQVEAGPAQGSPCTIPVSLLLTDEPPVFLPGLLR
jgi:uncharacterized protein YkwD